MAFKLAAALALCLAVPVPAAELPPIPLAGLPLSTGPAAGSRPPLIAGETLEYDIYWGMINVGRASLAIDGFITVNSRRVLHIVSEARSSSFINNFYKVDDRNEAWIDAEDLSSHGYFKRLSEGGHFINEWVVFDLPAKRYYGSKMTRKGQVAHFEGMLEYAVNDVLSALYRLRTMELKTGSSMNMDVNSKKNWRLSVKAQKTEKIETAYGKKKCLLVEPMVGEEGLFVSKAGKRMLVWITQDELKLPMMLKAEIFIGSVTAKLVSRTVK